MSPIVLVGTPRSGSTLFTRLLNESKDLFIVNDFYFLQHVDSIGGFQERLSKMQSEELIDSALERIQARIEREDSPCIECGLFLSNEQEKSLVAFARELKQDKECYEWSTILCKLMFFSSQLLDKKSWGYNTPQDFVFIDKVINHFPDSKFIFLIRDPRSVLKSYKNVTANGYHDPKRYNPIIQSIAWRNAIRCFNTYQKQLSDELLLIRYEDLVADANKELSKVASFLGTTFPTIDLMSFGNNSSYNKEKTSELSSTEVWICESILRDELVTSNYPLRKVMPKISDVLEITSINFASFSFYLKQSLKSQDTRNRIKNMFFQLFRY